MPRKAKSFWSPKPRSAKSVTGHPPAPSRPADTGSNPRSRCAGSRSLPSRRSVISKVPPGHGWSPSSAPTSIGHRGRSQSNPSRPGCPTERRPDAALSAGSSPTRRCPLLIARGEVDDPYYIEQAERVRIALCEQQRCSVFTVLKYQSHMSDIFAIKPMTRPYQISLRILFADNG